MEARTLHGDASGRSGARVIGVLLALMAVLGFAGSPAFAQTTIWSSSTTPAVAADPDQVAVELGVKFRASVAGTVSAIRFYKSTTNVGPHVVKLYSGTGTLLSSANATGTTASGWQQIALPQPVQIIANTTYVAAYYTASGRYAVNENYFTSSVTNGPLTALASGVEGGNGVYRYGTGGGFPNQTFAASNYWVDLLFTAGTGSGAATSVALSSSSNPSSLGASVTFAATVAPVPPATGTPTGTVQFRVDGANLGAAVPLSAGRATSTPVSNLSAGNHDVTASYGGDGSFGSSTSATLVQTVGAVSGCTGNAVVVENCLPGNPASEWDVSGIGDSSIQGFATNISVDRGDPVTFKITAPAGAPYQIEIYRLGYYGGMGARRVHTITGLQGQAQPACSRDTTGGTGLIDCGNWSNSATWAVPANATSGVYIARPRLNTGGASHIVFIVRGDASTSALLFQTSDTTWQAYNSYGGNSLYTGNGSVGRAYKVSYNRPFNTRAVDNGQDWLFSAEYPMIRWLERNGYDVTYTTGVDIDADTGGARIRQHGIYLSVGHDEYWSGAQRANVESARDAGVHLAFFSGNEIFWKTRWENSIADGRPRRTLVSYKETHANSDIDPNDTTGTWADPRSGIGPGRPQNALSGTLFVVNDGATTAIQVPAEDGKLRFWRNTSVATLAPGATATLYAGTVGYEWDVDADNGFRPPGLVRLSSRTVTNAPVLQDFGSTYASGTATHSLALYKHPASGALVFGAGSVQWSWGLDVTHDRSPGGQADVRMQQATVNLFADMGVQPGTLQSGLAPASASTDSSAPSSTITSPSAGATLAAGTLVTISGSAVDTGGGVVGGVEVSTDNGSTWHPASGRASWSYTWTTPGAGGTVIVKSRAADDSGNLEVPASGITVTVGSGSGGGTCPCSIWSSTATPTIVADPDSVGVELGVKFRSSSAGSIIAIRFYRSSTNTGPHTVKLWSRTGALLSSAPVPGNAPTGWVQVALPAPVGITANTTYLASYHTASGHYSATNNGFGVGVTNGPLTALANGTDGGNGVYAYGAGAFPTQTYNATNYWVDVVFTTTPAQDTTPPTVVSTAPSDGATQVSTQGVVNVTFSEPMSASTVNANTVLLLDPGGNVVPATVSYDSSSLVATLTPNASLTTSGTFMALVQGGTADPRVKDAAGNAMAADANWSFTTAGLPPTQGPGGPVLVVTSAANPFSTYQAEILRTEGLNLFQVTSLSSVSPTTLAQHDVVVLGQMPLTAAQVTMFTNWVTAGGRLVAMRPDKQLAGLLGLTDTGSTLPGGYLQIDTSRAPGSGLVAQTIQYRGVADRYSLNGATPVASLYSTATAPTTSPAVTWRAVGTSGGMAAAFTYDLARSVVMMRQGNPAWSGQERDGTPPIRSNDLFFGAALDDPQADWIDLSKVAIPQADEQQRLLANLIVWMNQGRRPLPRFWYFPRGLSAVVIMTGDDHGNGGTAGRFNQFIASSPSGCVVDDWQCIRGTSYVYPGTPISDAQAAAYHQQGFEIGLHLNTNCGNFTADSLDGNLVTQLFQWGQQFRSLPAPATNRTHCIAWGDYSTQPLVELARGIRLDTNYYYWPNAWINDRPGFFTGSGMVMRLARATGEIIDVYHAVSQMTDESGQTYPFTVNSLLDRALGPEAYYGAFTINAHTDLVNSAEADAVVASAKARGVPVIAARQMLRWLDGRNDSSFASVTWSGNTLSFSVRVGAGARGLQAMVPVPPGRVVASVTANGNPVNHASGVVKGITYIFLMATSATYQVTFQ